MCKDTTGQEEGNSLLTRGSLLSPPKDLEQMLPVVHCTLLISLANKIVKGMSLSATRLH